MRRIYKIILIICLVFWIVIFNPAVSLLVSAQDLGAESTPTPTPTPNQTIDTGDASASANSETNSNTDVVTITPTPEPSDTPLPEATLDTQLEATPSATPEDISPDNVISSDQLADVTTTTTSSSDTGNNSQSGSGSEDITTGNSESTADSVTTANLLEINSNLITEIQNIIASEGDNDIDLYQELMDVITLNPTLIPDGTTIIVNQNATVTSETTSSSNTGTNNQETIGDASITTGNADSSANAITVANLNLTGTNVILFIINALTDYNGNIILPSVYNILSGSESNNNLNIIANQEGNISSNTYSATNTGNNNQESGGKTNITTGDSTASANSITLGNFVQTENVWEYLIINNLGSWSGNLINWSGPGSIESVPAGTSVIQNSLQSGTQNCEGCSPTNIISNQYALVNTNVFSSANTGNNFQKADTANLSTGNASALANNITIANYAGIGSGLLLGIVNILGNWKGNIITAYPQLNLSLTDNRDYIKPGDTENYLLTITNSGHAIAHNVNLNFTWPANVDPNPNQTTNWNLGNIGPEQSKTFNLTGKVVDSTIDGVNLLATAIAGTIDIQSSTNGNTASDTTIVSIPKSISDTRTPDLSVDLWNSVNSYINVGDTIWVKITLANKSPYIAHNVFVSGKIYNDTGSIIYPLNLNVGDVKANGEGTITFNLTIPKNSDSGIYHITAQATGQAESGDSSTSNTAQVNFLVKGIAKMLMEMTNILPGGNVKGQEILGVATPNTNQSWINKLGNNIYLVFPLLVILYIVLALVRKRVRL